MSTEHFAEAARKPVYAAVIPVAGLGTRTLPASRIGKNLMPAGDRPLIQHAVEEAFEAGIQKIVIVCGPGDDDMYRRHFKRDDALEAKLRTAGKEREADIIKQLGDYADRIVYTVQSEPKGPGHAVLQAKEHIKDMPFAVMFPDDLFYTKPEKGCLSQMIDVYNRHGGNVIAGVEVAPEDVKRYGIIQGVADANDNGVVRATRLVEKPKTLEEVGGSRFAIMARYIVQPEVMDALEHVKPGAGGEIQFTDGMQGLLAQGQEFHGMPYKGTRLDYGTIDGRRKGEMFLALMEHPDDLQAVLDTVAKHNPDNKLVKPAPAPLPPGSYC